MSIELKKSIKNVEEQKEIALKTDITYSIFSNCEPVLFYNYFTIENEHQIIARTSVWKEIQEIWLKNDTEGCKVYGIITESHVQGLKK